MRILTQGWVALVAIAAAGCSEPPKPARPATRPATRAVAAAAKPPPATAPRRRVIDVASAEEFVKAVGPDRVLRLRAGKYRLSDVKQRYLKHLYWRQVHDGYELVVRDVKRLRIEAAEKGKAELLAKPVYAYVLAFESSADVELSGLVLGHEPTPGGCTGGVVQLANCRGAAIRDCELHGCGMEGLTLRRVEGLTFERSVIRDCTYGILTMARCGRIAFRDSRFTNNRQFHGFVIRECLGVKLERCQVAGNIVGGGDRGALFNVVSSSEVEMIGGRIHANRCANLVHPGDAMKFEGVDIAENRPPDRPAAE